MQKWLSAFIVTIGLTTVSHAAPIECFGEFEYGTVKVSGTALQEAEMYISFGEASFPVSVTDLILERDHLVVEGSGWHRAHEVQFEMGIDRYNEQVATIFIVLGDKLNFEVPLQCEVQFSGADIEYAVERDPRLPIDLPIEYPHVPYVTQ